MSLHTYSSQAWCSLSIHFCAVSPRLVRDIWGISPLESDLLVIDGRRLEKIGRASSERLFRIDVVRLYLDFGESEREDLVMDGKG